MIREAKYGDFPDLVKFGSMFWNCTPYAQQGISYNKEAINELFTTLKRDHYFIVSHNGPILTGMLGIWIGNFVFNPEYSVATELFYFVHPEYRGQGIGRLLHEKAEADLDVDILSFGTIQLSTDMREYYVKNGFFQTERIYSKVL